MTPVAWMLAAALIALPRMTLSEASPPTYVALGDSTAVGVGARQGGYPARLAARASGAGVPVRLLNAGVSGARVADLLAHQLPRALAAGPAVVTVGIGINDVTHGTDLDAFARDYERVAEALAAAGARVVVVNVLDLSRSPLAQGEETKRLLRQRVVAFDARIAEVAARHGFALVDLFAATADELTFHPELLSSDRFHPSDAGYALWAEVMAPAFELALQEAGAGPPAAAGPR